MSGVFHIKRGESIEIILDEDPLSAVACTVVWVGEPNTKQEGEVGLQTAGATTAGAMKLVWRGRDDR